MLIVISNSSGPLTTLRNLSGFQVEKTLSDEGKFYFEIPFSQCNNLSDEVFKLLNKVEFIHQKDSGYNIITGYITNIQRSNESIRIEGLDAIGIGRYRKTRAASSYSTDYNTTINGVYNCLDTIYPMIPSISVGTVTGNKVFSFDTGMSFYDILKSSSERGVEFRCENETIYFADKIGDQLGGVFKYNEYNLSGSNVLSREVNLNIDDVFNAIIQNKSAGITISDDPSSIANNGLIEKFGYQPNNDQELQPLPTKYPKIKVDANCEEWWNWKVGDSRKTSIYTFANYLNVDYIGRIRKIVISGGGDKIDVDVDIADEQLNYVKGNKDFIEVLKKQSQRIAKLERHN